MARKSKKSSYPKFKKIIIAFAFVIGIATLITAYTFYRKVFAPNVIIKEHKTQFIYIPTGYSFEDLMRLLQVQGLLSNYASFEWLSEQMNIKFIIQAPMGTFEHASIKTCIIMAVKDGPTKNVQFLKIRF